MNSGSQDRLTKCCYPYPCFSLNKQVALLWVFYLKKTKHTNICFFFLKKKTFSKNNIGNCIGLLHAYVFCSTYPFAVIWKNRGIGLSHFNLSCKQPRKINIDNVILKYASTQTAIIYYQKRIHFVLNCF